MYYNSKIDFHILRQESDMSASPQFMTGYFVESQTGYTQIQIQLWWQAWSDAKYGGNHKPDKYPDIFRLDDACKDHRQKKYPVLGKEKHITFERERFPPDHRPSRLPTPLPIKGLCVFPYLELDISFVRDPHRHHRITKYPVYPDISDHMSRGP